MTKKKPRIGRPPAEHPRDRFVSVAFSRKEHEAVKRAADSVALSISAYARQILLEQAGKQ